MKRDMNLVRVLLLRIESDDRLDGAAGFCADEFEMPGHSEEEVVFHILILHDAGMIVGNCEAHPLMIERLTWQGCEFLDDIRDEKIWVQAKERAKGLAGVGMSLLWELAKAEIKKKVGLAAA